MANGKRKEFNIVDELKKDGIGPTSWKDLADKPFGKKVENIITWDGAPTDVYVDMGGVYAYRISDKVFTKDELEGAMLVYNNGSIGTVTTQSMGDIIGALDETTGAAVYVVLEDNYNLSGITFPKAGCYSAKFNDGDIYITALQRVVVTKVDAEFIPDDAGSLVVKVVYDSSNGKYTADKTYNEIYEAAVAGKFCFAQVYGEWGDFEVIAPLRDVPDPNTGEYSGYAEFHTAAIYGITQSQAYGKALSVGTWSVQIRKTEAVEVKKGSFGVIDQERFAEYIPTLTSPNGTQYKLTVTDDGTLVPIAV